MSDNRTIRPKGIQRVFLLFLVTACTIFPFTGLAQNTKGDQPVSNTKERRELRFKMRTRVGDRPTRTKDIAGRRLRTRNYHSEGPASGGYPPPRFDRKQPRDGADRAYKAPNNKVYGSRPSEQQRAWKGSISGGRITVRSATARAKKFYPQRGPYVNNPSPRPGNDPPRWTKKQMQVSVRRPDPGDGQRRFEPSKYRVTVRSATSSARKFYPQHGPFVRTSPGAPRQRSFLGGGYRSQGQPSLGGRRAGGRRSVSGPYLRSKSINAYANYPRLKPRSNIFYDRDIAGRRLLRKNFRSPGQEFTGQPNTYGNRRMLGGDRVGEPRRRGLSITRMMPRAWQGDIAGRKLRRKSTQNRGYVGPVTPIRGGGGGFGDRTYRGIIPGGGNKSATGSRQARSPLTPRIPGNSSFGTYGGTMRPKTFSPQGRGYGGNIRSRRIAGGGGSISGGWNNNGRPVAGRPPSRADQDFAGFQGNLRRYGGFAKQGADYAGTIKTRRIAGGGGSISGGWNNNGRPVAGRPPSRADQDFAGFQGNLRRYGGFGKQGADYAGTIKSRRVTGAGGSASGFWNNNGRPVAGRSPSRADQDFAGFQGNLRRFNGFGKQGADYAGTIKSRRVTGAGGSASGFWNNNGQPVAGRSPSRADQDFAGFQGNLRRFNGFGKQGADYAGTIKAKRISGGGGSISGPWNNDGKPVEGRSQSIADRQFSGYQGTLRRTGGFSKQGAAYAGTIKAKKPDSGGGSISGSWNNNGEPLPRKGYSNTRAMADFTLKMKYEKSRPAEGADYRGSMRAPFFSRRYVQNPSSSDDALKVRDPGRATGKIASYQGNVRMKKYDILYGKDELPDTQFRKTNDSDVAGKRSLITNGLILWTKLFRKDAANPVSRDERVHKPRFDKGELGLWYDNRDVNTGEQRGLRKRPEHRNELD